VDGLHSTQDIACGRLTRRNPSRKLEDRGHREDSATREECSRRKAVTLAFQSLASKMTVLTPCDLQYSLRPAIEGLSVPSIQGAEATTHNV
jgi:hypothetical protein